MLILGSLISDHWVVFGCVLGAFVGAAWLGWQFFTAPNVQDDDARFFGES